MTLRFWKARHNASRGFAQTGREPAQLWAAALACAALSGCSIALPSEPQGADLRADASDITGSIRKPAAAPELSRGLNAEDLRRARAALGTALDPQGEGGGVRWDNEQTGAKGEFTPVGHAYPNDGKICRAFLAEVATKLGDEHLQGTACRDKVAEWTIVEVRPWRKG